MEGLDAPIKAFTDSADWTFSKQLPSPPIDYDTYGYPVSRYITSLLRADIDYLLMKPLEWAFLIFLYLVDLHPEKRINKQYRS
ncbi:MAG: hypothetical protein IIX48_05945 [Lachnospiraceae bacterium]|nr:hypothetical protein [Lachnospiraceae bacterium]